IGGVVLTWMGDWGWRLIFAVNLPLGGVALAMLYWLVPAGTPEAGRRRDVVGGLLATAGLLLMALGLTGDAQEGALSTALLLALAGAAVFAGFLFWESRTKTPMLPLGLFRNVGFAGAQALTFGLYFALAA